MHEIRIARQLTDERLTELLTEHGSVKVDLADFAVAPNPASTKGRLYGPATVVYVRHADGGIDTTVTEHTYDDQTHCEECGLAAEDGHMPSCSLYEANIVSGPNAV